MLTVRPDIQGAALRLRSRRNRTLVAAVTPEQIAEAGQRLAVMERDCGNQHLYYSDSARLAESLGNRHKAENHGRAAAAWAEKRDALALAQTALREWVPREDREKAYHNATECGCSARKHQCDELHQEARRLLKLEDTPDV